jgi:hypothetical protein
MRPGYSHCAEDKATFSQAQALGRVQVGSLKDIRRATANLFALLNRVEGHADQQAHLQGHRVGSCARSAVPLVVYSAL